MVGLWGLGGHGAARRIVVALESGREFERLVLDSAPAGLIPEAIVALVLRGGMEE